MAEIKTPMILTWFGKNVEELSREELIKALHMAADDIIYYQKELGHERMIWPSN